MPISPSTPSTAAPVASTCPTTGTAIVQLINDPTIVKLVQDGNTIVFILVWWLLIHGLTGLVKALR